VGDAIFNDPRLIRVYDALEGGRRDLDVYVDVAAGLGARSVLDIGCGTGTFACMLAGRGIDVIGVDPAWASLEIARGKQGAGAVRWLHGDATTLPPLAVDAAFMTGNVAKCFSPTRTGPPRCAARGMRCDLVAILSSSPVTLLGVPGSGGRRS
jgi:SAM-dependent methyltransferase